MKIKHTLTLFCVTLTLAFLLVSCADTSGDGGGSNTKKQFSNVSAESCADIMLKSNCFISVWNTENSGGGASATNTIVLPLVSDGTYDFYVDWGDGTVQQITEFNADKITHAYKDGGEKTIHIAGIIKGWRFYSSDSDSGDAVKLLDVTQWGSLSLGNTAGRQFYNAQNFNPTATDAPDLSETTDLMSAFEGATIFNGEIGNWDMSKVTQMNSMFFKATSFNQNIGGWDVSKVTTMDGMFFQANSFNNKDGEELGWGDKTSNVTNMTDMFKSAIAFNQDIGGWDVSKVTTMNAMFFKASSFNNKDGEELGWGDKTSNVTNMNAMFYEATSFNQDIGGWDVSKVTTMNSIFRFANKFNNNAAELEWGDKTSNVTDMSFMFTEATSFNQNIGGWDVSEVTDMNSMFFKATSFNQDIGGWDVSKVTTMNAMFYEANSFNNKDGEELGWGDKTSNVTNMNAMFYEATSFNQDIGGWDVSKVTTMNSIFRFANKFNNNAAELEWGDKTSNVTDMSFMFTEATSFNQNIGGWDVSEVTDMNSMFFKATSFNQDIGGWDVSKVTTMNAMFYEANSFNNKDGEELGWGDKTSNVTNMTDMFNSAIAFNQDIGGWNVSNVTTMAFMFSKAAIFNQDISGWTVEQVTGYDNFENASALTTAHIPPKFRRANAVSKEVCEAKPELNCFISVWNTENSGGGASATNTIVLPLVSDGTYDFYVDWGDGKEVEKITTASATTHEYATPGEYTIYIAGTIKGWSFNVSIVNNGDAAKLLKVTQWGSLSLGNTEGKQFRGAENFNPTASDAPDLSETTSLAAAFSGASNFNGAIGNWDVSKVTSMTYMFYEATNFNQDISDWNVSNVTNMAFMFSKAAIFNNKAAELKWGDKTSKVTDMQEMFSGASDFNQDISAWNVEKVTGYDNFENASALITAHIPPKFRGANAVSKEVCAAKPELNCFISVWNTENSGNGASARSTIVLPLVSDGTYDFYVDWGDESEVQKIEAYDADKITHDYNTEGEKTIHITGTIKGWRFYVSQTGGVNNYGDAAKLLNVTQWGSLSLSNTDGRQFQGAEKFNPTATDAPDVSETTSLSSAFYGASSFNGEIGNWDVSKVTDMSDMFHGASSFNNNEKGLEWKDKTSKVTNMNTMFGNAWSFNQDISSWNVSQVTDMNTMFWGAIAFNQNISGWNVGKVATSDDFASGSALITAHTPPKFRGANAVSKELCAAKPELNCFISVWNTTNSGNGASARSTIVLPLVNNGEYNFYVNWGDGEAVEEITTVSDATHEYATQGEYTIYITGVIKGWRFFDVPFNYGDAAKLLNVSQWGSLSLGNTDGAQFRGANNFNPTATDAPDVSETTSLIAAFYAASNFNGEIGNWDVSQVTNMNSMFRFANKFNNNGKPLDWGIKTSKVTNMRLMFNHAYAFNQDVSGWNVSEVHDMDSMFSIASSFNNNGKPLDWGNKTSKVTNMTRMFNGASVFNQDLSKWNVCNVTVANRANFDDGAPATWTAAMKPNWGMACPTN